MKKLIILLLITSASITFLYARFDMSKIPEYEELRYVRSDGITNYEYWYKKGSLIEIYITNSALSRRLRFDLKGDSLDFYEYDDKGNIIKNAKSDFDKKRVYYKYKDRDKVKEKDKGIDDTVLFAHAMSKVFRGYPWNEDKVYFMMFALERFLYLKTAVRKVGDEKIFGHDCYKLQYTVYAGFITKEVDIYLYYEKAFPHRLIYSKDFRDDDKVFTTRLILKDK